MSLEVTVCSGQGDGTCLWLTQGAVEVRIQAEAVLCSGLEVAILQ